MTQHEPSVAPRPVRRPAEPLLRGVTAAVDGGPADRLVLDFAVDDCLRRRLPLQVVRVVPPAGSGAGWKRAEVAGARVVGAAVRYARQRQPRLVVTWRVLHRQAVLALAAASSASSLLVVGLPRAGRLSPQEALQRLAARVRCPIVVVAGPGRPDGPVLTGSPVDRGAWRFAAGEAARRGCAVIRLQRAPAGAAGARRPPQPAAGRLPPVVPPTVTGGGTRVPAAYRQVDASSPDPLAAATADASLLVIGPVGAFGIQVLDTVGGRLLKTAACPLAVVGPSARLVV